MSILSSTATGDFRNLTEKDILQLGYTRLFYGSSGSTYRYSIKNDEDIHIGMITLVLEKTNGKAYFHEISHFDMGLIRNKYISTVHQLKELHKMIIHVEQMEQEKRKYICNTIKEILP